MHLNQRKTRKQNTFSVATLTVFMCVCGVYLISCYHTRFRIGEIRSISEHYNNPSIQHKFDYLHREKTTVGDDVDVVADADPDSFDCKALIRDFLGQTIDEMERVAGYEKSYITRTITENSFYFATHGGDIDRARVSSFVKGAYYEGKLSRRVTETFLAKRAGRKKSIMLDVGGNVGWFSLLAAAHGASRVYTFEPNVANNVRFCEALGLNGWLHDDRSKDFVVPIGKGVSNGSGTEELYRVDATNPGSYSFLKEYAYKNAISERARTEYLNAIANDTSRNFTEFFTEADRIEHMKTAVVGKVDVITLDSFAERRGWFESRPSIGFFKLDVEGSEHLVLQGARKLLESRLIENIAMEIKADHTGENKKFIVKTLFDAGYGLHMHGGFKGPNKVVKKIYGTWEELVGDIMKNVYRENVLFRLRHR
mmetsp:Transcript_26114/g.52048  ORF Transcript_26114/g.52048 Transcript_26114/m.52048 type:complete len:424 (+) Transcript_26114:34-1305(+)